MTTPRQPGVFFDVVTTTAAREFIIDEVVYMVGEAGTDADASFTGTFVSDAIGTVEEAHALVGNDGDLSATVDAIFEQASPTLFIGVVDPTTDGSPTDDEVVASLDRVRTLTELPAIIMAPGLTAGTAGNAAQKSTTTASDVVSELESLAAELDCLAVADGAGGSVANYLTWLAANRAARVMCVGNRRKIDATTFEPASGHWVGTALHTAAEFGRQHGVNYQPVRTIPHNGLELSPSISANPDVTTDVSRIIAAFGSVLVERHGEVQIVGDTMAGFDDVRSIWSVLDVIDHLDRVIRLESERWQSVGSSPEILARAALALQRSARELVTQGELISLEVIPNADENTAEARAARQAFFDIFITTAVPIAQIQHHIHIET